MKKIASLLLVSTLLLTATASMACEHHAPSAKHTSQATAQQNKAMVMAFYQKLFGDKNLDAIDEYIVPDYIQHNPNVADGRDALRDAVTPRFKNAAKETIDIRNTAAEGDLVFLHIRRETPSGVKAIVDIFRVQDGKIVEHWDVMQDAPATAANAHPMF